MDELVKKSEGKHCPYAESVNNLYNLLAKAIKGGTGFSYVYTLRKNIAYSLQYLECLFNTFLNLECFRYLKIAAIFSNVLRRKPGCLNEDIKTMILFSFSIPLMQNSFHSPRGFI